MVGCVGEVVGFVAYCFKAKNIGGLNKWLVK